ncbi:MAG: formylmethanofuran dehydrogenase subunit E family protein [Bryobacterales bacterium]|nr:formylmethanofuran dehydrogenase subunit E family protein [Bryobacterales bacterium]
MRQDRLPTDCTWGSAGMQCPLRPVWQGVVVASLGLLLVLSTAAQHATSGHGPDSGRQPGAASPAHASLALERVAAIHGQHGPFAVAGYRMGEAALRALGLSRGSFELEVVHHSPAQVQWSCIADGLQAATGASAGKLNLRLVETSGEVYSLVRNQTGQSRFELNDVRSTIENLPHDRLADAGVVVMQIPAEQVYRQIGSPSQPGKEAGQHHAH